MSGAANTPPVFDPAGMLRCRGSGGVVRGRGGLLQADCKEGASIGTEPSLILRAWAKGNNFQHQPSSQTPVDPIHTSSEIHLGLRNDKRAPRPLRCLLASGSIFLQPAA